MAVEWWSPCLPSFPCFPFPPRSLWSVPDREGVGREAAKPGSEAGTRRRRVRNTTVEPPGKANPPSGRAPGPGVEWRRWVENVFFFRKSAPNVHKTSALWGGYFSPITLLKNCLKQIVIGRRKTLNRWTQPKKWRIP
ncbi:hypothetical protein AKJ41_00930 [candidate division MSBL1 archaeon SCGC-AAA259O05]|uniref:Uncharacterized protein n=1 Tax=candidate division MSBL1 archaeon SCGC-AAA259O05 TaxID=1698271 RepID=A0A133V5C1_9EURY|nr:hypothetical protein AKJ41_00930 [candidate division MSBL1 archaeon SCGC-AAA259O05]